MEKLSLPMILYVYVSEDDDQDEYFIAESSVDAVAEMSQTRVVGVYTLTATKRVTGKAQVEG